MRVIDRIVGADPGPTLIVIGGMHGNEPAGVAAAQASFAALRSSHASIRGEYVALRGNVAALAARRRFFEQDLNRMWTDASLARARAGVDRSRETNEQIELAHELDQIRARARGPMFVLDLHTTSARGVPFLVVGPTAEDRAFALQLPLPGIVGLEVVLEGVLTGWMSQIGCVAMAVEGGQSGSPEAESNLSAVLCIALVATGIVASMDNLGAARALLSRARGDLPQLIEVASRHALGPGHDFQMEPGFANIHRTSSGALLAREAGAEIRATFDGFVLLPLYQPEGRDGFFYGRSLS